MRLLHVYAGPFPTVQGTQALVGRLCAGLASRGHEIHLLCYAHAGWDASPPYTVHRIPDAPRFDTERSGPSLRKVALDASLALSCRRLRLSLRPDVVHAHHVEAMLAARLADPLRSVPLVFHAHALIGAELGSYVSWAPRSLATAAGRALDLTAARLADRVLVISPAIREELIRGGIDPARIAEAPVPADPEDLKASATTPLAVDETSRKPISVAYVGNLDAYQGIDNLLAGLAAMPAGSEDIVEIEIITASDPASLIERIDRMHLPVAVRVRPHGSPAEARGRLAAADVAIVPRHGTGGFPIKLVSALSLGRPVIADRRVAGHLVHGEEAWLVDMCDPRAVAGAILLLASDPALRDRLGRGARLAAMRHHDPDAAFSVIEDAYAAVKAGAPRRRP